MPRALDHLVLAVRDLEVAARFYERLGFQVGGRNRHPWGTENRLVQFPDSFIELITIGEAADIPPPEPGSFSFGAFVQAYLAQREGLALLVLDSADAKADAAAFARAGIGAGEPFFFDRSGRRPDGSETYVAFTLAFAHPLSPSAGFFACQQNHPENFWNAALQTHGNGAQGVGAVALAAAEPEAQRPFLEAFAGAEAESPAGQDLSLRLARGRIDVLTPDDAAVLYGSVEVDPDGPSFVAFTVDVADLARVARRFEADDTPHLRVGARLVVPASAAHGVAIAFEER